LKGTIYKGVSIRDFPKKF